MNKMFKEAVKTIKNHPQTTHTYDELWNKDLFTLKLNKADSITICQDNYDLIVYKRQKGALYYEYLYWNEDNCFLTSNDEIKEETRIDPELAYFQIMTDIKEKAAHKDDQEL